MPNRKTGDYSEPPLEFYCLGGRVLELAPGASAQIGKEVDPGQYFGPANKEKHYTSFGVIERSDQDVNLHANLVWEPKSPKIASQHIPVELESSPEPLQANVASAKVDPPLVDEQQRVVDFILAGRNVFYTGSAGCGKSTILRAFVHQLRARGKTVRILAPTNLAALNVGGVTTWAFAGWRVGDFKKSWNELERKANKKQIWRRLNQPDVLVIDEISMCENLIFERLNRLMKAARGKHKPFGGVQLVVTGDFFQLSPVKPFSSCIECGADMHPDDTWNPTQYVCENPDCFRDVYYDRDKWAFRSEVWEECNFEHINLTQIHRQNDQRFISILQKIRIIVNQPVALMPITYNITDNEILPADKKVLLEHISHTDYAIEMYPKRNKVDEVNTAKIMQLPSPPLTFRCKDFFEWKPQHRDKYPEMERFNQKDPSNVTLSALSEHRYEPQVQLKRDMRVLLLHNLHPTAGIVNGSQGTIIGFEKFDYNKLPRKGNNNRSNELENGAPLLDSAHRKYCQYQILEFAEENGCPPWPVVQFDNGLQSTIYPHCSFIEHGDKEPYSLLSRTQIPLTAGYAITVHKAQGMTLDKVKVDLSEAFERSQVYVALSRARSLDGLEVMGLPNWDLGGPNVQVKEFFEKYLHSV